MFNVWMDGWDGKGDDWWCRGGCWIGREAGRVGVYVVDGMVVFGGAMVVLLGLCQVNKRIS